MPTKHSQISHEIENINEQDAVFFLFYKIIENIHVQKYFFCHKCSYNLFLNHIYKNDTITLYC